MNDIPSALNARIDTLKQELRFKENVRISRPTMPDLGAYTKSLEQMWESGAVTNVGAFHHEFEKQVREFLGVQHVNLFCNGTMALLMALHSSRLFHGEIITTPFTFPGTPHAIHWNGATPVFCDIDPTTWNLDPARIEEAITPKTVAILPVHVFGTPCDVDAIQAIADKHGLKVIYDAAHTFGAKYRGEALSSYGDMSIISFHAAKIFSSAEGGCLVSHSEDTHYRIGRLTNFGIIDADHVMWPGINGKMTELCAAYGIEQLKRYHEERSKRDEVAQWYAAGLSEIPGIQLQRRVPDHETNHGYFPILVNEEEFGVSRDTLHDLMVEFNIGPRKYFYPLCSHYACYRSLPSSAPERLPVAERVVRDILCLPIYGSLDKDTVQHVVRVIREIHLAAMEAQSAPARN